MEIVCKVCGMKFTEQIRHDRHFKTHQNKTKKTKNNTMPDFDQPRFDQVM